MFKQNKAITLIALIITIIVLLILAGVTINMVMGENGIINKSTASVGQYENEKRKETELLKQYENEINNVILHVGGDKTITITYHANGGKFEDESTEKTISAGYKNIVFPTVTHSEKTFKDWYTAESGGEKIQSPQNIITEANTIDLYAQWYESTTNPIPSSTDDSRIIKDGDWSLTRIPYYAFDNNDSTYACDASRGQNAIGMWLGWDFETPVYVTGISGLIRMKGYKIQYADAIDGNWEDALIKTSPGSDNGNRIEETISNYQSLGPHRYWRFIVNGGQNSSDWSAVVYSLKFNILE